MEKQTIYVHTRRGGIFRMSSCDPYKDIEKAMQEGVWLEGEADSEVFIPAAEIALVKIF